MAHSMPLEKTRTYNPVIAQRGSNGLEVNNQHVRVALTTWQLKEIFRGAIFLKQLTGRELLFGSTVHTKFELTPLLSIDSIHLYLPSICREYCGNCFLKTPFGQAPSFGPYRVTKLCQHFIANKDTLFHSYVLGMGSLATLGGQQWDALM